MFIFFFVTNYFPDEEFFDLKVAISDKISEKFFKFFGINSMWHRVLAWIHFFCQSEKNKSIFDVGAFPHFNDRFKVLFLYEFYGVV